MKPLQSKKGIEKSPELCYNVCMSCSGLSQRKEKNEYERKT